MVFEQVAHSQIFLEGMTVSITLEKSGNVRCETVEEARGMFGLLIPTGISHRLPRHRLSLIVASSFQAR